MIPRLCRVTSLAGRTVQEQRPGIVHPGFPSGTELRSVENFELEGTSGVAKGQGYNYFDPRVIDYRRLPRRKNDAPVDGTPRPAPGVSARPEPTGSPRRSGSCQKMNAQRLENS